MKAPDPTDFIKINSLRGEEYDGLGFTEANKKYQLYLKELMEHDITLSLTIKTDLSEKLLTDKLDAYVVDVLQVDGIHNDDSLNELSIDGNEIGFESLTIGHKKAKIEKNAEPIILTQMCDYRQEVWGSLTKLCDSEDHEAFSYHYLKQKKFPFEYKGWLFNKVPYNQAMEFTT